MKSKFALKSTQKTHVLLSRHTQPTKSFMPQNMKHMKAHLKKVSLPLKAVAVFEICQVTRMIP